MAKAKKNTEDVAIVLDDGSWWSHLEDLIDEVDAEDGDLAEGEAPEAVEEALEETEHPDAPWIEVGMTKDEWEDMQDEDADLWENFGE